MGKRFCIRGHDTYEVGRVQRMCRQCRRDGERARSRTRRRQQEKRAWFHAVGYLRQLNRRVAEALRNMEVKLGGHR